MSRASMMLNDIIDGIAAMKSGQLDAIITSFPAAFLM